MYIKDLSKTKASVVWIICNQWCGLFGTDWWGNACSLTGGVWEGEFPGGYSKIKLIKLVVTQHGSNQFSLGFLKSNHSGKLKPHAGGIYHPSPLPGFLPVLSNSWMAENTTHSTSQARNWEVILDAHLSCTFRIQPITVSCGFYLLSNSKCLLHCSMLHPW